MSTAHASDMQPTPSPTAGGDSAQTFSDYLNPPASDDCEQPVAERVGNWFCAPSPSASSKPAQADAGGTGNINGTWSVVNDYNTSFSGNGVYGYGSTTLGTASMSFKVVAKGTVLTVNSISFKSTRGTSHPTLEAEILYTSAAYPGGNSQTPRQSDAYDGPATLAAGSYLQWPSPAPSWAQKVTSPTAVVEIFWRDPSSAYPGRWFMYAKSIKFKEAAQYYIPSATKPSAPSGAGWSS